MKITVVGGRGVCGPLFVASALRRAKMLHLDEICLMDIRPDKLEIMAARSRSFNHHGLYTLQTMHFWCTLNGLILHEGRTHAGSTAVPTGVLRMGAGCQQDRSGTA